MKTKEEWTKIRDEMAVAYLFGSSDAEHMQEFAEFIGQIQLDSRAELLSELAAFKQKLEASNARVKDLELNNRYQRGYDAGEKSIEQDRDHWKSLAGKLKYHAQHGSACDAYVDQDHECCTCGLAETLKEMSQ